MIEVLKQALAVLENWMPMGKEEALLTNLRAAIEQMEKVEPAKITDKLVCDIIDEADKSFRWHQGGIRGQMITVWDSKEAHIAAAAIKLTAPVAPAGWALVPIEPTREMLWQICPASADLHEWEGNYKSMLAAAPEYKP